MGLFRKDTPARVIKGTIIKQDTTAHVIAFDVDPKAGVADVKSAVEDLFKVKVEEVRLFKDRGKDKGGRFAGKKRDRHKAYVRLKEEQRAPAPEVWEPAGFVPTPARNVIDLVRAIEGGLPISALHRFQTESTLPMPRVLRLVRIPARTYARRREEGRLSAEESDRLMRVTRLFASVTTLFGGDVTAAVEWLSKPLRALGGAIPLDIAETETGSHELERVIQQLEHGVFP